MRSCTTCRHCSRPGPAPAPSADSTSTAGRERLPNEVLLEEPDRSEPVVGVVMGSSSDWPMLEPAAEALNEFAVPYEVHVVSAHRTPRRMLQYAETAAARGLRVIIAGAGGAA